MFASGVLVDTGHPRRGHLRLGQRVDQVQDRAPADVDPERFPDRVFAFDEFGLLGIRPTGARR
ncbi:hypothetical protein [Streptomyces sannanensis]|uniref:hypothetical protein n=1 Tax=Streptomyces sannanensis TaxID=285536 RepID=UPI0031E9C408